MGAHCAAFRRQPTSAMSRETWQQFLASQTPATAERDRACVADLPMLAAVRFHGPDARKFLQGYLTCDTDDLTPHQLTATAVCNLKGRVVITGWATARADGDVRLILHHSLVGALQAFLAPYLRFSRTRLLEEQDAVLVLGGLNLPAEAGCLPAIAALSIYLTEDAAAAGALWQRYPQVTAEAWLAALTEAGMPVISARVSERFLPQMLDLDRLGAVDFAKGCYLGQEVVARAQHRGAVKRHLRQLRWQGQQAPAAGVELIDAAGTAAGTVVQSATSEPGHGPALAVMQPDRTGPFHPAGQEGDLRLV